MAVAIAANGSSDTGFSPGPTPRGLLASMFQNFSVLFNNYFGCVERVTRVHCSRLLFRTKWKEHTREDSEEWPKYVEPRASPDLFRCFAGLRGFDDMCFALFLMR